MPPTVVTARRRERDAADGDGIVRVRGRRRMRAVRARRGSASTVWPGPARCRRGPELLDRRFQNSSCQIGFGSLIPWPTKTPSARRRSSVEPVDGLRQVARRAGRTRALAVRGVDLGRQAPGERRRRRARRRPRRRRAGRADEAQRQQERGRRRSRPGRATVSIVSAGHSGCGSRTRRSRGRAPRSSGSGRARTASP